MVLGTSSEYALANTAPATLLLGSRTQHVGGQRRMQSLALPVTPKSDWSVRRFPTAHGHRNSLSEDEVTESRREQGSTTDSLSPRGRRSERQARYRADGGCRKSWRGAPEAIGRERSHQSIEGWPAADRAGSVRLSLGRGARRCGRLRHPKRQGPPTIVLLTVDVSSQQRLDSGGSRILAHRPDPRCSSRATVPRAAPCAGRSRSPVGTTTVARPCIASGVSAKKGVGTRSSTKACETTTVHRSPLQRPEQ